jgi:hypothetical protein
VKDESAVPQNQKALGKKKEDCRADKPWQTINLGNKKPR